MTPQSIWDSRKHLPAFIAWRRAMMELRTVFGFVAARRTNFTSRITDSFTARRFDRFELELGIRPFAGLRLRNR